jgi:hypothetical protein
MSSSICLDILYVQLSSESPLLLEDGALGLLLLDGLRSRVKDSSVDMILVRFTTSI